jgi:hypothetical protein
MTTCTEKGKVYLDASNVKGISNTYVENLRREWELAEDEFEACLDLVMSNKVKLNDTVREQQKWQVPAGVSVNRQAGHA